MRYGSSSRLLGWTIAFPMRRLAVLAYYGKQNFIRENDFYECKRLTSSVLQQKKNSDLAGGVAGLSGANWCSLR